MNSKTTSFYTLGCKLNFSETSTISRDLEEEGYAKIDFELGADIYVINTCSVTDQADKKCRNIVRKALKYNPNAFIVVIGCYAQLKPEEISRIEGVDLVLGAQEKFNISNYLKDTVKKKKPVLLNQPIKNVKTFYPGYSAGDRTRSFFKVQDGCNYFCSFCTIPLARGKSRSGTISQTIDKAKEIGNSEVKEVVLTGINLGDFGHGTKENFYQLINELEELNSISRFRISSIEPDLLSEEIIEFVNSSEKFVPHFHIPLQSGSNFLLKKMRRKYNTDLYSSRIKLIKKLMPHACIGVDVIVGFPGETEEEFNKTIDYIKSLPVSYLHVFTYSERANTNAPKMNEIVPMEIRRKRSKQLRILSLKLKLQFYNENIGYMGKVLFESKEDNFLIGFTENYLKVKIPFKPKMINTIQEVRIEKISSDIEAYGSIVKELELVK
ncbi:MAG: Threonylcarbamoyladenosine tRNA methylthiotransferase MtaB [Crocinitomicaceae bacterium]|nr:MAG: Threonylcarbamoyladenosine tRNA methylthiotransferase MtaB [Crocinitomicaceae bacterium]|tara:strand:+ start:621 stop:1934 length:1314 start_codon:yes stop_codon:yes gene_type:complete